MYIQIKKGKNIILLVKIDMIALYYKKNVNIYDGGYGVIKQLC